jgi:AAA+ superfamily predicted ATPase
MLSVQLQKDLLVLENLIQQKVELFANGQELSVELSWKNIETDDEVFDYYHDLVKHYQLSEIERGTLLLAFVYAYYPLMLDFLLQYKLQFQDRKNLGGKSDSNQYFKPTIETAVFLFTNGSIDERTLVYELFNGKSWLLKHEIIQIESEENHFFNKTINISSDYRELLLNQKINKPDFSSEFPAKLVSTNSNWEDLILADEVMQELNLIEVWQNTKNQVYDQWGFGNIFKPGYKALFYGPSGTGKTMAAVLLGKKLGIDVYKIDVSQLVSKYIGETAKNLEKVFHQAENKNWILFFDEAESLFSKRGNSNSSNDKYSNQEVGYLLQRIEDYSGIVILATNLKSVIDDAFTRRFQNIINFPIPDEDQRFLLWTSMTKLPNSPIEFHVDYKKLSHSYELTGGMIANVIRECVYRCVQHNSIIVDPISLEKSIKRELQKQGKYMRA